MIKDLENRKASIQKDIVKTIESLVSEANRLAEIHKAGGDTDGAYGLIVFSGRVDRLASASSELRTVIAAFKFKEWEENKK